MFKKHGIIVLFVITSFSLFSYDNFEAEIYDQDDDQNEIIFDYRSAIEVSGEETSLEHLYYMPSGELFAREKVVLINGEFSKHETNFYFLEESSQLFRREDSMEIFFEREEKLKNKEIKIPDDLIFGPTQQDFIINNLEEMVNGKKVSFSLPVPEFLTAMKFTMKKIDDSTYVKPGMIALEMKTTNFLLWFIAKPIQYIVDENTGLIQEIHGPTILKRKIKDKWEYFDADIFFNYP